MEILEFENSDELNDWFAEECKNSIRRRKMGTEERAESNGEYYEQRIKVYRTNSGGYWILIN